MKKLLNSYGVRVLAFILCLVLVLGTAACALSAAIIYYEMDLERDSPRDFAGSTLARDYGSKYIYGPLFHTISGEDVYYGRYTAPDEGFSYTIYSPDGELLSDTRTADSVLIEDQVWRSDGYYAYGYVNLPTSRDTVLYNYVTIYDFLYNGRNDFLKLAIGFGTMAILLFVFLMAAAGRTADGVRLGGLHRWPLGIYLGGLFFAGLTCVFFMVEISYWYNMRYLLLSVGFFALLSLALGIVILLGLMTLAARWKTTDWWRNTVTFFCVKWGFKFCVWFIQLCWKLTAMLCVWGWKCCKLVWLWCVKAVRGVCRGIGNLVLALPLTWKGVGLYCVFTLLNVLFFEMNGFFQLQVFLMDAVGGLAVIWVAMQLKKLQKAGKELAAGNLGHTVDTSRMLPTLREHAENLNAVGLGMTKAVNERMKSERFKTELITNVSHDLKTPLTSIVSYVDLLKNEEIDNAQAREYIEVLDRQSQRLKKLTTDLVDASKASSGVIAVNMEQVDLAELLRQSAGEYAERFAAAQLDPVVTVPEGDWVIRADGRLLWRVLDNLLTNAVKYALPGTRVYMALSRDGAHTTLFIKNISRDALNIPAEELMERFVRGDASRSTEGSGLGLSIAQSLMELMGGALRLTVDGDLFKAELVF